MIHWLLLSMTGLSLNLLRFLSFSFFPFFLSVTDIMDFGYGLFDSDIWTFVLRIR